LSEERNYFIKKKIKKRLDKNKDVCYIVVNEKNSHISCQDFRGRYLSSIL